MRKHLRELPVLSLFAMFNTSTVEATCPRDHDGTVKNRRLSVEWRSKPPYGCLGVAVDIGKSGQNGITIDES